MAEYFKQCNLKQMRIIRAVGREADRKVLGAYVVGGTVRDILLKKRNLDLDFTVEGDAIALARSLARRHKAKITVHRAFKTASLMWPGGNRVDLATTRQERYAYPGALPTVKAGSLKQDLFRRDFTVNAMAISVNRDRFGQLFDDYNGLADLKRKQIRILHEKSFIDDPTRILRAIRFEQRLSFSLCRKTLSLLKRSLKGGCVNSVKLPRYFAEFKKILAEDNPLKPLQRLKRVGGLAFLDKNLAIPAKEISLIRQRLKKADVAPQDRWLFYFTALMAQLNCKTVERLCAKLPLAREQRKAIEQTNHIKSTVKGLKMANASEVYDVLCRYSDRAAQYAYVSSADSVISRKLSRYLNKDRHVRLAITGMDLKHAGIRPGKNMGKVLYDVLLYKIEQGRLTKRQELKKALESLGKA